MARKNSNKGGGSRRNAASAAPEVVLEEVETGGAGIDEGIVFATFLLLAGAVTLIYTILEARYPL
jgi:hypothetical protein